MSSVQFTFLILEYDSCLKVKCNILERLDDIFLVRDFRMKAVHSKNKTKNSEDLKNLV